MTIPSPKKVYAHEWRYGGLWLVVPAERDGKQPKPIIVLLTSSVGISEPTFIWFEGKTLLEDVIAENENLQGAEWVPVDSRGNRV